MLTAFSLLLMHPKGMLTQHKKYGLFLTVEGLGYFWIILIAIFTN
jgi:hypothetical protein